MMTKSYLEESTVFKSAHKYLIVAASLSVFSLFMMGSSGRAEAPMQKVQASGFYRFMLGAFEVTALSDGTVKLPVKNLLTNTTPEKIDAALKRAFLPEAIETSVNAYLINTGSKLVLIDTGAAGLFGPTLGNMLSNLKASGYKPEQVDEIYITHLHPDHVGGLLIDGQMAFPNAIVRVDKDDAEFWLSDANMKAAPKENQGFFQGAMASVDPYVKAGKFKVFDGNVELVPGVRAQSTHGHTTGHTIYVVESQGEKLVLWGDLMHVAAVQFDDPSVTIAFDADSKDAAMHRKAAYADAARGGFLVGSAHISFPGVGRLRAGPNADGYSWIPHNYTSMK
jgi:glyoxylase-like metal-dependent hydrolase (beta-lactamase superfamily II)